MDLSIWETHNGGDIVLKGNDLQLVTSIWNQPYLAMFGGNKEQSHQDADEFELTLERFDFWGNMLVFPDDPNVQYNSEFEKALDSFALSSAGRQQLESILKEDINFLRQIAIVSSSISIVGLDQIQIDITLQEPDNLSERNFVFLWDGTRLEEIIDLNDPRRRSTPSEEVPTLLGDEGQFLLGDDGEILFGD